MTREHPVPDEDLVNPIANAIFDDFQARLRQHRQAADEATVALQQRLLAAQRRRSTIGASLAGALIAPAVIGTLWLGMPVGALAGWLAVRFTRSGWLTIAVIALIEGVVFVAGAPFLWRMLRSEPDLASLLMALTGAAGLAAIPLGLRWLSAPRLVPVPPPDGDPGLIGRFVSPTELVERGARRTQVSDLNFTIRDLQSRGSLVLVVAIGMCAAWLLHPVGGLGIGQGSWAGALGGAASPARAQAVMAVVGALAAALIARLELAVPLGMLTYGLPVCGVHILLIISGQAGFTAWFSMWIWLAWIICGGLLSLVTAQREQATPLRTT